jgi:hypothetical protein
MAGETLPLNFRVQGRNQNTPIRGNCLTMPVREMSPEFFLILNNSPGVADVHTSTSCLGHPKVTMENVFYLF